MATGKKFSPKTKPMVLKYHHFRSHVKSGHVDIYYRPTGEKLEDLLTKPLSNEAFFTLRYILCGWSYGEHLKLLVLMVSNFPTQHRKLVIFDSTQTPQVVLYCPSTTNWLIFFPTQ